MRVLVAEDDPVSSLVLRRTLERLGYQVVVASDGLAAWRAYDADRFPIVVSDWMMPGMDGLALCQRIRASGSNSYTYVILMTARRQREDRVQALDAGIDDFLTKPLDSAELAARMRVARRILMSEQQLQDVNDSLVAKSKALATQAIELDRLRREAEYLATHDVLTGVLSRRAWLDAGTTLRPTALAIFDVDRFKAINDRYGHPVGDNVLRQVTGRLVEAVSPCGTVGRLGGEEFGALFEAPFAAAERACLAAVEAVATIRMSVPWQPELEVTVSAGLSRWLPTGKTREESLARTYEAADRALYEAKHAGRRRLVVHEGVTAA